MDFACPGISLQYLQGIQLNLGDYSLRVISDIIQFSKSHLSNTVATSVPHNHVDKKRTLVPTGSGISGKSMILTNAGYLSSSHSCEHLTHIEAEIAFF